MSTTKTPEQAAALLASLGLPTDSDTLVAAIQPSDPAKVDDEAKRRATPASEIVFDPALIADIVLDKDGKARASRVLFEHYKSPGKDTERHSLLHRRITEFLTEQTLERKKAAGGLAPSPAGRVRTKARKRKEEADIVEVLASELTSRGMTAEDLIALLAAKA